ncbi:transposase [[Kitasatospora] papulosa]|uniref:transposase n=1 Tax=[Kitasatospora] papulosa TaxID=1464011 RepID=UPI0036ACEB0A
MCGEPDHHALGRSRGGLTTKIHLATDSRCQPLAFVLTPGQSGDAPAFDHVMAGIRVPRPLGRPRTTPDVVLAAKAHSSRAIRTHLRRRRIRAVIPACSWPAGRPAKKLLRGKTQPHVSWPVVTAWKFFSRWVARSAVQALVNLSLVAR